MLSDSPYGQFLANRGTAMLASMIPNYRAQAERLTELAPAGWVVAFNLSPFGPKLMDSTYPSGWQDIYKSTSILYNDPVFHWIQNTTVGMTRWSDIPDGNDPKNLMSVARQYGLIYGAAFTSQLNKKLSFLSASRTDRELTDVEMSEISATFRVWADLLDNEAGLSPGELQVLALLRDGLGQQNVADELGLSLPAVKARLKQACLKLKAANTTQAVAIATATSII